MAFRFRGFPVKWRLLFVAAIMLFLGLGAWLSRYLTDRRKSYYTIGVFYDSNTLQETDMNVVRLILGSRIAELNAEGGIGGRNLRLTYFDDRGSPDSARAAVQKSISDKNLIAYIGCWGSTKAAAISALLGKEKVPYLGGYSVPAVGSPYPNMFTYEIGVKQFAYSTYNLLKNKGKKVAFVGNSGDIFTETLLRELKALNQDNSGFRLVSEKWYPGNKVLSPAELDRLTDSLKAEGELLLLSTRVVQTNVILKSLLTKTRKMPVFCAFVDIPEVDPEIPGFREAELYDISVFGIPSALNLRTQVLKEKLKGQVAETEKLDFLLGFGSLLADGLGLLKTASELKTAEPAANVREKIVNGLQQFINGDKVYNGRLRDWYFTPERALVSDAVLGWKPPYLDKPILAPFQFLHGDSALTQTQVFYTNIDLVRLDRVSDEENSYNARFYLEINAMRKISLDQIEFANAVRNEVNHEPLLDVKLIRADTAGGEGRLYNYLYKVNGKFFFARNLKDYPFDAQQFPITLQTNTALASFLIQPAGRFQRDSTFRSPGWLYASNFVGYDQDLIYTARNIIGRQRHIPYYKFNYTYVLKRAPVDFFLKVLTPLLAILIISYFSVFIPYREFEALCAIQVTALLAVIALYFSTYKPELQNATISDKIFIFTYIMITSLIGTSILIYTLHFNQREKNLFGRLSRIYQLYVFPAIVAGFTVYLAWF